MEIIKNNLIAVKVPDVIPEPAQNISNNQNEGNYFPADVFPEPIQEIIQAGLNRLDFPVDFVGASILSSISIAIGNTHKVKIKSGFIESPILYIAIVSPPGTNKTQALNFGLKPLINKDNSTFKEYQKQFDVYDMSLLKTPKDRAKMTLNETQKPVWKKFLLSDFTLEALAELHQKNERGIGVYADELAGWFKNFGRYNNGSEQEFWLKSWSNIPFSYDRKGSKSIFIPSPFVSVVGTIQNGMLHELAKDNRNVNGFIDRILFVKPDNLRKPYWNEKEIDPVVLKDWDDIISKIMEIPLKLNVNSDIDPYVLRFSTPAKEILFEWQRKNTDMWNGAETEVIASIYSKLEVYIARLALILEISRWACGVSERESISVEAIKGAIKLIEYFRKTAIQVNALIAGDNPLSKFPKDKQELYNALPDYFKTEEGISIANDKGMPERTFKRFLNNKELFQKMKIGQYGKCL